MVHVIIASYKSLKPGDHMPGGIVDLQGVHHPNQPAVVLREVGIEQWIDQLKQAGIPAEGQWADSGARFYEVSLD